MINMDFHLIRGLVATATALALWALGAAAQEAPASADAMNAMIGNWEFSNADRDAYWRPLPKTRPEAALPAQPEAAQVIRDGMLPEEILPNKLVQELRSAQEQIWAAQPLEYQLDVTDLVRGWLEGVIQPVVLSVQAQAVGRRARSWACVRPVSGSPRS